MAPAQKSARKQQLEKVSTAKEEGNDVIARSGKSGNPKGKGMAIGDFYAFLQCQLRMEARELMGKDFAVKDPAALSIWPLYERLETRNQGKNEKWVPYHTVLGVHEYFVVQEIHHARVPCWTPYRRFVAMFIFRSHCQRDLFQKVQMPHLSRADFWKDPVAAFKLHSPMHRDVMKYRRAGNVLQTSCFLIIPERLVKDDNENIVQNLLLRTQRLITLADELWPIVQDAKISSEQKFMRISEKISGVYGLGETWVKMLMVVIDIAIPKLKLLQDRCEVGTGAMGGLRQLLEDEGLIEPQKEVQKRSVEEVFLALNLKGRIAEVRRGKYQLLQVTGRMAGSLDRAHAIAARLCKLGNGGMAVDALIQKKTELLADTKFKVPELGLDKKADAAQEKSMADVEEESVARSKAVGALGKLCKSINDSNVPSSKKFWKLLAQVEAHGRNFFAKLPLVAAQMQTARRRLSAVTLQVQLCEWRQFQNYQRRNKRRPARDEVTTTKRKAEAAGIEDVAAPCKRRRA
mmetsp:Transcript_83895/g.234166  ORF Transcript_83895/g.234166 Transcript_83895/m.234166 type:complete len:517 (-) Transcript_83895:125-1675(-)